MPLAIFIIVIMAGLALTMARTSSQSSSSAVQTMVSIQAFYAADAGAQYGMNQLFYIPDPGPTLTRGVVDTRCDSLENGGLGQSITFTAQGIGNCSTQINCTRSADGANTTSYYQITSSAQCGSGTINAQRTVDVSAMMR